MSKPMERASTLPRVRSGLLLSLAAATVLTGCVAEVRPAYSPPPPPPAYAPPPPAAPVAQYEASAPAPEIQEQATQPPPPLPDYQQPPCPQVGFLWTPGYWAFSTAGYYWIPGTWVAPPVVGVLWTPGYWGFVGGVYAFHAGYWGPHIGFYGGVNYGFGYGGVGFVGGRWEGGAYHYNTAVTNVNTTVIHNTYVNNVTVNNVTVNKVSYNGGTGGVAAQPTPAERHAMAEPHTPPTPAQVSHVHEAVSNPQLAAKVNGGHPAIAATTRAGAFTKDSIVPAKGAPPLKPIVPAAHAPRDESARARARQRRASGNDCSEGARARGQGASARGQGASARSQGARARSQGARARSQAARARGASGSATPEGTCGQDSSAQEAAARTAQGGREALRAALDVDASGPASAPARTRF